MGVYPKSAILPLKTDFGSQEGPREIAYECLFEGRGQEMIKKRHFGQFWRVFGDFLRVRSNPVEKVAQS